MSKTERGTERGAAPAPQGVCLHGRYILGPRVSLDYESGFVYSGRDQRTGEALRIRAMPTVDLEPAALERAQVEFQRLQLIRKPHFFPRVRDLIAHDGFHYVVQEAIAGDAMPDFIEQEGVLPDCTRIGHLFQQIAHRLSYLHNHVHGVLLFRGLTPERVIVEGDTRLVRLVDLSIPGLLAPAPGGRPGHGTGQCHAPELYRGEAPSIYTDVYALGRLLQFLVFGETEEDPDPSTPIPDAVERGVSETMRELVTRMIAPDPSLRPRNVESALRDFTACLDSTASGFGPTPHEKAPKCEGCKTPLREELAFCSRCGRLNVHHQTAEGAIAPTIRATGFDRNRFSGMRPVSLERYQLLDQSADLARRAGYERLVLPDSKRAGRPIVELLEMIRDLRGRALVVGPDPLRMRRLASSLITEYRERGWLDRALILAPAGLSEHWRHGLEQDGIEVATLVDANTSERRKRLKNSQTVAVAPEWLQGRGDQKMVCDAAWDLVVVDAAHLFASKTSVVARMLRSIHSKYLVLLSATPVQNDALDLLQLLRLVRPDLWTMSQQDYKSAVDGSDSGLRDKLDRTLIEMRTATDETQFDISARVASPSGEAEDLYRVIVDSIASSDCSHETLVLLHRALASASVEALEAAAEDPVASTVATGLRTLIEPSLHPKTRELVDRLVDEVEGKTLVFVNDPKQCRRLVKCLLDRQVKAVTPNSRDDENDPAWKAFTDDEATRFLVVADGRPLHLPTGIVSTGILFDLPWQPTISLERAAQLRSHASDAATLTLTQLVAADTIEPWLHTLFHEQLGVLGGEAHVLHALQSTMEADESLAAIIGRVAAEQIGGAESVAATMLTQRIAGIREHVGEATRRGAELVSRMRGGARS